MKTFYWYLGASTLSERDLLLQTSTGSAGVAATRPTDEPPRFFRGFLTTAHPAALGLLAVAEVAQTRYFRPRDPASRDLVAAGSRDRLRFESFSGCCGVYAQLDVLPAGLDGELIDRGTTNVDVNPSLRRALTSIGCAGSTTGTPVPARGGRSPATNAAPAGTPSQPN